MSYYLGHTEDFIKLYYEKCTDSRITRKMAYELTEKAYYLQNKEWIEKGKMKETKFANYESFASSLSQYLKNNKRP